MNRIVVITGSASGIGRAAKELFIEMGDTVIGIDVLPGEWAQGDLSNPAVLEAFAAHVLQEFGHVDVLINNAPPLRKGLSNCSYEEFMEALRVGVAAPFYLSQLFKDHFGPEGCILNVSSTRDSQSQMESESYAAAKGGIRALTHALAVSMGPSVRVNSISPGWIDTTNSVTKPADHLQQPCGRVGKPDDVAWLMAFLASDAAGFIDGENITLDGGMSKLMIYHQDHGWNYTPKNQLQTIQPQEPETADLQEPEVIPSPAEELTASEEVMDNESLPAESDAAEEGIPSASDAGETDTAHVEESSVSSQSDETDTVEPETTDEGIPSNADSGQTDTTPAQESTAPSQPVEPEAIEPPASSQETDEVQDAAGEEPHQRTDSMPEASLKEESVPVSSGAYQILDSSMELTAGAFILDKVDAEVFTPAADVQDMPSDPEASSSSTE